MLIPDFVPAAAEKAAAHTVTEPKPSAPVVRATKATPAPSEPVHAAALPSAETPPVTTADDLASPAAPAPAVTTSAGPSARTTYHLLSRKEASAKALLDPKETLAAKGHPTTLEPLEMSKIHASDGRRFDAPSTIAIEGTEKAAIGEKLAAEASAEIVEEAEISNEAIAQSLLQREMAELKASDRVMSEDDRRINDSSDDEPDYSSEGADDAVGALDASIAQAVSKGDVEAVTEEENEKNAIIDKQIAAAEREEQIQSEIEFAQVEKEIAAQRAADFKKLQEQVKQQQMVDLKNEKMYAAKERQHMAILQAKRHEADATAHHGIELEDLSAFKRALNVTKARQMMGMFDRLGCVPDFHSTSAHQHVTHPHHHAANLPSNEMNQYYAKELAAYGAPAA